MAFSERRTVEILLTILFFSGICAAIYGARRIFVIFVFAILFAYLINPLVKFLQRYSLFFRDLRGRQWWRSTSFCAPHGAAGIYIYAGPRQEYREGAG